MELVVAMILSVAVDYQLPPNFVLAVAVYKTPVESVEDIRAEWRNENSARLHAKNLRDIAWQCYRNTWWTVALWYQGGNGLNKLHADNAQIEYAIGVIDRYEELEGGRIRTVVGYTDDYGFY